MFSMDTSESEETIRKMKNFILQSLPAFNISEKSVRISIVTYSGDAIIHLPFREGVTESKVNEALQNIAPSNAGKRLDTALYQAVTDWRDVPRNVILFMNGPSTVKADYVKKMVGYLRDRGVQINIIAKPAVGKDLIDALKSAGANVAVVQPGGNVDQFLHLVQPLPSKSGNQQSFISLLGLVSMFEFTWHFNCILQPYIF